ncbi:HAD-like domain containing protein [Amanita muscaria]
MSSIKAVIFDIGGVVLASPLVALAAYEKEKGLPPNYLNCMIVGHGPQGAWQRFERGEIPLSEFYESFTRELSDVEAGNQWFSLYCRRKGIDCPALPKSLQIDGRELFGRMMRESQRTDPIVQEAIHRIRAAGKHKIIALTNNYLMAEIPVSELSFLGWDAHGAVSDQLKGLFDDFCESSVLGMRKPEPEIYLLTCRRNGIKPEEAVFLDDLGINLKAAKDLGIKTIRVKIGESHKAIAELEAMLGLVLQDRVDVQSKL